MNKISGKTVTLPDLTEWCDASRQPASAGIYRRRLETKSGIEAIRFAYWDGKNWHKGKKNISSLLLPLAVSNRVHFEWQPLSFDTALDVQRSAAPSDRGDAKMITRLEKEAAVNKKKIANLEMALEQSRQQLAALKTELQAAKNWMRSCGRKLPATVHEPDRTPRTISVLYKGEGMIPGQPGLNDAPKNRKRRTR